MSKGLAERGCIVVNVSYRLAPGTFLNVLMRSTSFSLFLSTLFRWLILPCASLFLASPVLAWSSVYHYCWWSLLVVIGVWNYVVAPMLHMAAHPAQAQDIAAAIAWTIRELPALAPQADVRRVFLAGHSAGGHLVALLATDPSYLSSVGLAPSAVAGVVCVSGIYDLSRPCGDNYFHYRNVIFRAMYVYGTFGWRSHLWHAASPLHRLRMLDADRAPVYLPHFLVLNGMGFGEMGLETDGRRFADALGPERADYFVVPNCSHASIANRFDVNGGADRVAAWLGQIRSAASQVPVPAATPRPVART